MELVSDLTDMDSLTTTDEYYRIAWTSSSSTISNLPANFPSTVRFFVKVFQASSNYMTQEIMNPIDNSVYQRFKYKSVWSSWIRVDNFGCSTLAELKAALANV